jgi:hypothetical protein
VPLTILIAFPWLAAVPAGLLFLLYRSSRRRWVLGAALGWLLYGLYEYGMRRRWLCSGECNIRVDLLLLYPALLAVSGVAVLSGVRGTSRGDDHQNR